MNKPNFYCSSDYAGLSFKNGSFYYGYEHSICSECGKTTKNGSEYCDICEDADREWCFMATINGEEIVISFSKLGATDMFDVVECLNMGIGWILTKYRLVKE